MPSDKKRASNRRWREANPEKHRQANYSWRRTYPKRAKKQYKRSNFNGATRRTILRRYGLTLEDYDAKLASQGSRCAICRRPQSDFKRRFAVDHNHKTKRPRGLLCDGCNPGLGFFKESVKLLKAAIKYLRKYK